MRLWERLSRYDNICRLYGACYFTTTPFVIMDYCDKGPLDKFLRQDEINRSTLSLEILSQAAQAVSKMHSIGIVHGDLKCDNILVWGNTQVKICDFDRSFDWSAMKDRRLVNGTAVAAGIAITDAVRYLAPECVRGMLPSTKSDVYSFGMALYHALMGGSPYADISSDEELRTCKLCGELPSRDVQLISDGAWKLITQCCDSTPDQRPTIEKVIAALRSLLSQQPVRGPVEVNSSSLGRSNNELALLGVDARTNQAVIAHSRLETNSDHHSNGSERPLNVAEARITRVRPDLGNDTPVKSPKSRSRSISRSCKRIGAAVLALVVIGAVLVVVVVGLKSSSSSDASTNTGSGGSSSSASGGTSSSSGVLAPSGGDGSSTSTGSGGDASTGSDTSTSSAGDGSSSSSGVSFDSSSGAAGGVVQVSSLYTESGLYVVERAGIVVTSTGVMYFSADATILRMTEGSGPIVYAGSHRDRGYADGALLDARFYAVCAIALSSSGDLFICDYDRVRKITGGTVSTLYNLTYDTGSSSANKCQGIAVDSSGNVYVADYFRSVITKITPQGVGSTFSTSLICPRGIAIDSSDNIFVTSDNQVFEFTSGGGPQVVAGSSTTGFIDGIGTSARFNIPVAVAVGSGGNLYVADEVNRCIRKLRLSTKEVTTYLTGGPSSNTGSIAVAAHNVLYVLDRNYSVDPSILNVYKMYIG